MNIIPRRSKRDTDAATSETSLAKWRQNLDELTERLWRDPFSALNALDAFGPRGDALTLPRTDLAEDDTSVTVTMELPGVIAKDVDISVAGDTLVVRGEKKQERESKDKHRRYYERQFGSFERTLRLPGTVDPDKVEAAFNNGVLTITVAKKPGLKPRKITVRNA
ncbi:MAG: Hsp20/alpha crystallin family protein [Phycisphaerae bacterium]